MENNETPNRGISPEPNANTSSNSPSIDALKPSVKNTHLLPTERIASKPTGFQRFFSKKTFLALFLLATLLGAVTGLEISYQYGLTYDAQAVKQLADYKPSLVTQVIADDGKTVIGEFSLERRMPLSYDEIPLKMRQAVMAIEDARFKSHWGIDPIGIARAGWRNFQAGSTIEGGSTLTQQLAKMLFLSPEKSLTRKMKEALLALQIERQFTKQQIMEFYCNQIFLGGGSYGIEAGAQYYFGKSVKDLELEDMALLAGLPKAPSAYSPTRDINRAKARRNLVLDNMAEEGFISRAEADTAKSKPIKLNVYARIGNNNSPYGYFVEEVRQYLEESYGTRVAHTSGMKVYTTLNADAQRHAMQAVRRGLHDYSRRHPSSNKEIKFYNVITSENVKNLDNYKHSDWDQEITEKMYLQGLVMNVDDKVAKIKFGEYQTILTSKDVATLKQPLNKILKKGDLAICNIKKVDQEKKELTVSLEQLPQVAGAFICIEAATGEIKAMVGGYDFNLSKFNNATQGNRQTGSSFKPFIYAAALEDGWLADEYISDAPVSYGTWSPHNYDGSYMGSITLRKAIAQSRNIPAVKLLESVGIQKGAEVVKRFGVTNPMAPYLPSALGATEVPLIEMVAAYTAFPNQGSRAKAYYVKRITDPYGRLLEEKSPELVPVISPYVAGTMASLMQGVVEAGTAKRIKSEKEAKLNERQIAGKTGTVNDFTDAWFIGYTPSLVAGFWIGYQGEKKSLGKGETGGSAALPVWIDFMKYYLKDTEIEKFPEIPEPDETLKTVQEKRYKEKLETYLAAKATTYDSSIPLPDILMSEDGTPPVRAKALPTPPLPPGYDPENSSDSKESAHSSKLPSAKDAGKIPTKPTVTDVEYPVKPPSLNSGKSSTKPGEKPSKNSTPKPIASTPSTVKPTTTVGAKPTTTAKPTPATTSKSTTAAPSPSKSNVPTPSTNKPTNSSGLPKVSSVNDTDLPGTSRPRVVRATPSPTSNSASKPITNSTIKSANTTKPASTTTSKPIANSSTNKPQPTKANSVVKPASSTTKPSSAAKPTSSGTSTKNSSQTSSVKDKKTNKPN